MVHLKSSRIKTGQLITFITIAQTEAPEFAWTPGDVISAFAMITFARF